MATGLVLPRRNLGTAFSGFARSPNIWWDCPWDEIQSGQVAGQLIDLTFQKGGLITSPTTEAALIGYPASGFGSSGSTQTYADEEGGGLVLTEATDNEAVFVRTKTCPFQVSANKGKLWFEVRLKVSSITDNALGWIVGLWDDTTTTVAIPLSAANPPIMATTGNFIGFRAPEEDAGGVNFVYDADDSGQTTDAEVVVQSLVYQGVADTYVNLGMVFDPKDYSRLNSGRPTIASYVNNIVQTSVKTVPNATGTDFPADVRMGLMAGIKLGTSTSTTMTIQWMRAAQLQA